MSWHHAIEIIRPHVLKIETPAGYGSGFLAFYNFDQTWCGIATAAHVVGHAEDWNEPIRVRNEAAALPRFLKSDERVIFVDHATDSAIVLFFKGDLELPDIPISLMPIEQPCSIGVDIGWLGYPAVEPDALCYFSGTVSARQTSRKAYLVDGVAINGVSGGPVFHCLHPESPQIIGCVTAYHPNRATGEALPGLLRAQDVSHFHQVTQFIRTFDEARAQKREFEESRKKKSQDTEEPGPAPRESSTPGGDSS